MDTLIDPRRLALRREEQSAVELVRELVDALPGGSPAARRLRGHLAALEELMGRLESLEGPAAPPGAGDTESGGAGLPARVLGASPK